MDEYLRFLLIGHINSLYAQWLWVGAKIKFLRALLWLKNRVA